MSSLYPSSGRQALQNLLTSTRHRTLIFANKDKRDLLSEDEPPSYDDAQDWSSGLTRGLETPFLSQIGAPGRITISWSQFSRVETTITSCLLSNSVLVQKHPQNLCVEIQGAYAKIAGRSTQYRAEPRSRSCHKPVVIYGRLIMVGRS